MKKKKRVFLYGFSVASLLASVGLYAGVSNYLESTNTLLNEDLAMNGVSYLVEDVNGNRNSSDVVPEGRIWEVGVNCTPSANGSWDYDAWGPIITDMNSSKTKCMFTFIRLKPLKDLGINSPLVDNGDGLYRVDHKGADITYTSDTTAISNLQQTEYRYAGLNPNNYVTFNGELWRIIGLVNTPEGQRLKLIRSESIGEYSWDSSDPSINSGIGINEWSNSAIMKTLNPGYDNETIGGSAYYNRGSSKCYSGSNTASKNCDFSAIGLSDDAKNLIDTVTWNLGTQGSAETTDYLVDQFYSYERSNAESKICSSKSSCNDSVTRTISWQGQVGLMYPSDYGYATSGGSSSNRDSCLSTNLYSWDTGNEECRNKDWLLLSSTQWTMTSAASSANSGSVFYVPNSGVIRFNRANYPYVVRPVVYLKENVHIISGDGSRENSFQLEA